MLLFGKRAAWEGAGNFGSAARSALGTPRTSRGDAGSPNADWIVLFVCAAQVAKHAGRRIKTIMERKINIVLWHAPLAPADPIIVFIFCSFS